MEENKVAKALYDHLISRVELGDYAKFENDLATNDAFRKAMFDEGSTDVDWGDYATFESNVKKKGSSLLDVGQGTGLVSQEPSKEPLTPQQPLPSTKKERDTTVTGDLLRTFTSTSKRMVGGMAGLPMLLNRTLATYTIRPIIKAMGATDEEAQQTVESIIRSNTMGQLASVTEEAQKVMNKSAQRDEQKMAQIEGSIWENLTKGKDGEKNVGAGFEQLGRMVVGFLPYSALTAATAGAGTVPVIATMGATAAAQKYSEMEGTAEPKRILNSWMYGGFEGVGEAASAVIFRGIGKAFRQGLAKQLPKNIALSFAKGAAESVGLEASSEVVTQIGQNFTDIVTGVDPQRGLFDGVLDVALGSAAFGLITGGGGRIAASVLGRTLASDKETEQVQTNLTQQGTLADQIESTDSDPVKKALESRLKTLRYEADKVMDKNFELAKELTPEQRMKVAELYSTWNELQAKIDNGEVTNEVGVKTIEDTVNGIKEEIQSIKEATLEKLGEIKKEGAKFKIGDTTFETEEAVEAWLDKNYQKRGLPPIWHTPTEKVIDAWYKRNKEEIDKRELQPLFKTEEETKDAEGTGIKNKETVGNETPELVGGKEGGLSVLNTEEDGLEAVKGEEVSEIVVAPFYNTQVKSPEDADALRQSPEYKQHVQNINDKATALGLEITDLSENIGHYTNDAGEKITELSNSITIKGTYEQAQQLAAVLGATTPEVQETTIAGHYVKAGDTNHESDEVNIEVTDFKGALAVLDELGIDYTLNQSTNTFKFLDFSKGEDLDFKNNIITFANRLKEKGIRYGKEDRRPTQSRLINAEDRRGILGRLNEEAVQRGQGGTVLRGITEEATKRNEEFLRPREKVTQGGVSATTTEAVTGEGGITAPPEQIPPVVPPTVTPPVEGEEKRTLGIRALASTKIGQDIKEGIEKEGINYIPRGRKVRAEEAQEIVSLFSKEEGGLDKVSEMVYNTKNEIPNDTRTYLNVYLAAQYDVLKNKSTDQTERDRLRQKVIDLYMFGMEQGTEGGQWVEAQKEWGKVFGNSPEMASALIRNRIERRNKAYFQDKETELKEAKQLLDDILSSPEGKERIEQEVAEEISKIGTKNFGKESKKKIDDFFNGLLIDPKRQNLYGGLLGIPVAAWNGSVLAVKNAVLLGVDIATAIQRGVDYLDKWYREEHAKGRIASPDWNKGEYEAHMKEQLGGLKKEVPLKEKAPKKKEPKVKTPPTQEEIVNKLLGKMAGFATRKQLQGFMKDYMQEFQERGMIDDKRFRELLAKALGLDYVSDETQAKLTKSAQTLGYAQKKIREVIDAFDKLEAVEPNTREFDELRAQLKKLQKEAEKASFEAQKANQYIKTLLTDEPELLDKIGTLIQGNLLVPTSIIRNIYGNVFMLPARATRYLVMNTMDAMLSQVGIVRSILGSKVDPAKHPDMYRWIKKLPTTERTVNMFGSLRGYREGVWSGLKEGARQVLTGQLEDDYKKKEVQRGLEPIKALLRLKDSLTGKEKRSFDKLIGDILEAMPAGYVGEGMFRLLNLGDKPFRRAAERARLSEMAEIKGLKGLQRERFLNNPDNASLIEAQKAGDIAVYTNDNVVSKLVEYANKVFRKGEKSNVDAVKSTSTIAKVLFKLGKATILPYVRTPVNLAIEAFEYAVPMYSLGRSMEAAYKGKRREALDYFGKAIVGTIISSIAVNLIKAGIMTPASSDDDKLKQAEFTGKEGYRLNIDALHRKLAGESPEWQDGDETVTLKGYGTLSMIFMAYGAAYKDKTQEEIGTETAPERWATVFGSVVTSSLEQSIMTGVNTALQAALKGEKERDRWLINTATALSSAVYPNTIASISKTFADENYIRETRDMSLEEGKLRAQMVNNFKDRMFMGKDLPTKVSIWGEKVKLIPDGNTWTYNLLGVTKNKKYQKYSFGTKMYELYEEYKKTNPDEAKGIFPTLPSPSTKVGWDKSLMTPEQLQNYQIRVGELRAEYAENYVNSEEFKDATIDERVNKLTSMYSKARRIADSEMFRWSGFEKNNPDQWGVLSESDAVPLPSNIRKIKSGMREFTLDDAAIEQLNVIALDRYAQRVVPWLENNNDRLATLKEINERTKESPFLNKTNREWDDAITYAKRIMASVLREKE